MRRGAGPIDPLAMFRRQALKSEFAGLPEQVRPDLALLEFAGENALWPARQQAGEAVLAQLQRQLAQILAVHRQDVEGIELHLLVVPAGMQAIKLSPHHVTSAVESVQGLKFNQHVVLLFASETRGPRKVELYAEISSFPSFVFPFILVEEESTDDLRATSARGRTYRRPIYRRSLS